MVDIYEVIEKIIDTKICSWFSDIKKCNLSKKNHSLGGREEVDKKLLEEYIKSPETIKIDHAQRVIFQMILRYYDIKIVKEFFENDKEFLLPSLFNETTKESIINNDISIYYYFLQKGTLTIKGVESFLRKLCTFFSKGRDHVLKTYLDYQNNDKEANIFLNDITFILNKTYKYLIERWAISDTIQELKRSFKILLQLMVKLNEIPYEFFLQQFLSTVTWNVRFQYIVLPFFISPIVITNENEEEMKKLINDIFERTTLNQFNREYASITCPTIVSIATIVSSSNSDDLKNCLFLYLYHMFTFSAKQVNRTACKLWIPRLVKVPGMKEVFSNLLKKIGEEFVNLRSNYYERNKEVQEYREETCIDYEKHTDAPHELEFKLDNLLYSWIVIYNSLPFKDTKEIPHLLIAALRYRSNFVVMESLNLFISKFQNINNFSTYLHEFYYNHMSTDDLQIREIMIKNLDKLNLKKNDPLAMYINSFLLQDISCINYQRLIMCLSIFDYYPDCYIGDGDVYLLCIGHDDCNVRQLALKYVVRSRPIDLEVAFKTILEYIDEGRNIEVGEDVLRHGILELDKFKNNYEGFQEFFDKLIEETSLSLTFSCYLNSIVLQNFNSTNFDSIKSIGENCMKIIKEKLVEGGSERLGLSPPLVDLYENLKKQISKEGKSVSEITSEFGVILISYSQGVFYNCKTLENLISLLSANNTSFELIEKYLKKIRDSALRTRHKGINDNSCEIYQNCIKTLSKNKNTTKILENAHKEFKEIFFNPQFEARNLAFWRIFMIFVDEGLQDFDELIPTVLQLSMPQNILDVEDSMKIRCLKLLKAFLSSSNYTFTKYYPELLEKLCQNYPIESYPVRSAMGHVFGNLIKEIFCGWPESVPYFNFILQYPKLFYGAVNAIQLLKDSINNPSLFFVLTIFQKLIFVDESFYDEEMIELLKVLKSIFIEMLQKTYNYFIREQLVEALFNLVPNKKRKNFVRKLENFTNTIEDSNLKITFDRFLFYLKQEYPYNYPNPKFSNYFSSSIPVYKSLPISKPSDDKLFLSEVLFIFENVTSTSERLRLQAAYKIVALAPNISYLERALLMDEIDFIRMIACEFGTTPIYPSMDNPTRILNKISKLIKSLPLSKDDLNNKKVENIQIASLYTLHTGDRGLICDTLVPENVILLLVHDYATQYVNRKYLNGIGLTVTSNYADTCDDTSITIQKTVELVGGSQYCKNVQPISKPLVSNDNNYTIASIGCFSSEIGATIVYLFQAFCIPVISAISNSVQLDDYTTYPYFLRTGASNFYKTQTIIHLIQSQMWFHIIVINDSTMFGNSMTKTLKNILSPCIMMDTRDNLFRFPCVERYLEIPFYSTDPSNSATNSALLDLKTLLQSTSARVIVLLMKSQNVNFLLNHNIWNDKKSQYQFIIIDRDELEINPLLNYAILIEEHVEPFHPLDSIVDSIVLNETTNIYVQELIEMQHLCCWNMDECPYSVKCKGDEKIMDINKGSRRQAGLVFDAVNLLAVAIKNFHKAYCNEEWGLCDNLIKNAYGDNMMDFILNATFTSYYNDTFKLYNRSAYPEYDIYQYINDSFIPLISKYKTLIGPQKSSTNKDMLQSKLRNETKMENDNCQIDCSLSHSVPETTDTCCWSCKECRGPNKYIDSGVACKTCPKDKIPALNKSTCIPEPIPPIFIKPNAGKIICLTIGAFGVFISILSFIFLYLKRGTPMYKASTPDLLYAQLLACIGLNICSGIMMPTSSIYICIVGWAGCTLLITTVQSIYFVKAIRIGKPKFIERFHFVNTNLKTSSHIFVAFCAAFQLIMFLFWLLLRTPSIRKDNLRLRYCSSNSDYQTLLLFTSCFILILLTFYPLRLALKNRFIFQVRQAGFCFLGLLMLGASYPVLFILLYTQDVDDQANSIVGMLIGLVPANITFFTFILPSLWQMIFKRSQNLHEYISRERSRQFQVGNIMYYVDAVVLQNGT
uniref:G-protein coupled receptors family 3 profile domain-containing protein n=1 Tax=Strongyloides stercoralis TaxID=6248 RepID=A0AAF5CQU0_STRER